MLNRVEDFDPKKLKEMRIRKGVSKKDINFATGIHETTIWNWERGKTFPSGKHLQKISDYFNVTLDYWKKDKIIGEFTPTIQVDPEVKEKVESWKNPYTSTNGQPSGNQSVTQEDSEEEEAEKMKDKYMGEEYLVPNIVLDEIKERHEKIRKHDVIKLIEGLEEIMADNPAVHGVLGVLKICVKNFKAA